MFLFVCLPREKAVQLPRTGGFYIQFWIHYLSKTLGELSIHHRSPSNVEKFLQNNNLKFLRKRFCKFFLYKRLWVFFASIFFQKISWILKYFYCNQKATDKNSTVLMYNFDGFLVNLRSEIFSLWRDLRNALFTCYFSLWFQYEPFKFEGWLE